MTRAEWFMALAALAYPADRIRAENAMAPYAPWFDDMPDAAFTRASLEAVVTSPRKMAIPSYDEIRRPLATWWRDNRPAAQRLASEYPALPGPSGDERRVPSEAEKHIVGEMVAAFRARTATPKSTTQLDEKDRPTPRHLTDRQLLAEYDRVAQDPRHPQHLRDAAAYRARFLRQKLGLDVVPMAAE